MPKLTDFLLRDGKTDAGVVFQEIMYWRTANWEINHDFIQWIFPSPEGSQIVPNSPVLTQGDYDELVAGYYHLDRLVIAKGRILTFLDEYTLWMLQQDHNHLRITRTIKCLSLFRGSEYADIFRVSVLQLVDQKKRFDILTEQTKKFWSDAVGYRETQGLIKWK